MSIEIDVWVRGTANAATHHIGSLPNNPQQWDESHVRQLITAMLLALNHEKNPAADAPEVSMRGFSWIVSPYEGGVVIHLETQTGTASAGPIAIAEEQLSMLIARVMQPSATAERIH